MAPQYQTPGFVHAQDYSQLPQSIDNLFTAYFRGKNMALQQDQQAQALQTAQNSLATQQSQFASQNMGLTPDRFNAVLPMAGQQAPGVLTPQSNDDLSTVNHILALHQASQQMGAQQAQAGLAKTQAEAAKTASDAAINNMFTGAASGESDGSNPLSKWSQSLRSDVASGLKAPSQAQSEASRLGPNGMGRLIVDNALSGLDQTGLEAKFKGKEALASTENSAALQVPQRLQKSLLPSFDYLDKISQNADKSKYQLINKVGIALAAQKGDRLAQHLQDVGSAISEEFAANLGGTGSDAKLALGMSLFDKAKTADQIHDAVTFMRHNAINRSEAYAGKEPSAIPVPEQFRGKQPEGPASSGRGPVIGTIEGGYKFRGGNPASPASWVKL